LLFPSPLPLPRFLSLPHLVDCCLIVVVVAIAITVILAAVAVAGVVVAALS